MGLIVGRWPAWCGPRAAPRAQTAWPANHHASRGRHLRNQTPDSSIFRGRLSKMKWRPARDMGRGTFAGARLMRCPEVGPLSGAARPCRASDPLSGERVRRARAISVAGRARPAREFAQEISWPPSRARLSVHLLPARVLAARAACRGRQWTRVSSLSGVRRPARRRRRPLLAARCSLIEIKCEQCANGTFIRRSGRRSARPRARSFMIQTNSQMNERTSRRTDAQARQRANAQTRKRAPAPLAATRPHGRGARLMIGAHPKAGPGRRAVGASFNSARGSSPQPRPRSQPARP